VEEAGATEGTTIAVRDLFYNTPARLKFMKKDSAETAAVAGLMQHLALSHPDISFKFIKDGQETLHTPGDGKLDSAVYAALGRDFAKTLVPVQGRGGEVSVSGFVTAPLMGRGSRSMQVFFVNGRFIKSQLLTAAVEEGYRNQIMKGKFPGCVLSVTLPVTAVDVNVHPAKTQVKFAREREVFDAVYHTVLDCLDAKSAPTPTPKSVEQVTIPRQDFFQSMDAKTYREQGSKPAAKAPERPAWNTEWRPAAQVADSGEKKTAYQAFRPVEKPAGSAFGKPPASVAGKPMERRPEGEGSSPTHTSPPMEKPAPIQETASPEPPKRPFVPAIPPEQQALELPLQESIQPPKEAPWRIAGEVLHTYIICESEDGCVWLIDKHAAHERVNFDRLKAAQEPPMRQTLLQPIAAELEREDGALLLENLPLLEEFGFGCEDFGDGAILVREVPADIDAGDTVATLEEFTENLRTGRNLAEKRENLLHTMACKAAIKGGWTSDPAELRVLVDKVQSGEVKYCPHGRPVAVKLTKYELERMFKRA
jgi:DNA mismatch repair protein MutL